MSTTDHTKGRLPAAISFITLAALLVLAWWFFHQSWPRGEALTDALQSLIQQQNSDQSLVAKAILDNYTEARSNASRWSGIYWGFTFAAAAFSALAGLILKFEIILKTEGLKKDIAAILSVSAALLITISTSGDFQRKWQANRTAAAELERTGYELLENSGKDARTYLASVGQTLLRRHLAILGSSEEKRIPSVPAKPAPDKK